MDTDDQVMFDDQVMPMQSGSIVQPWNTLPHIMDDSHFPCNKLKTCCKRQEALEIRRQKLGDTERAAKEMLDLEIRMASPDEELSCFHMHNPLIAQISWALFPSGLSAANRAHYSLYLKSGVKNTQQTELEL